MANELNALPDYRPWHSFWTQAVAQLTAIPWVFAMKENEA